VKVGKTHGKEIRRDLGKRKGIINDSSGKEGAKKKLIPAVTLTWMHPKEFQEEGDSVKMRGY